MDEKLPTSVRKDGRVDGWMNEQTDGRADRIE